MFDSSFGLHFSLLFFRRSPRSGLSRRQLVRTDAASSGGRVSGDGAGSQAGTTCSGTSTGTTRYNREQHIIYTTRDAVQQHTIAWTNSEKSRRPARVEREVASCATRLTHFLSLDFVCVLCVCTPADTGAGAEPFTSAPAPASYGAVTSSIGGKSSGSTLSQSQIAPDDDIGHLSIHRPDGDWTLSHPIWRESYLADVHFTHLPPTCIRDKLALWTIKAIRFNFDW